jgi:hypothetical protein
MAPLHRRKDRDPRKQPPVRTDLIAGAPGPEPQCLVWTTGEAMMELARLGSEVEVREQASGAGERESE